MYTVMLVDDEKWIVQSIKAKGRWEKFGFRVVSEAYNGEEAFARIQECRPDLVLTDIRMPGLSGLELMAKVKESGQRTEFVVVSGYSDFEYVKQALQLGAVDYMLKSVEEEELDEVLGRLKIRMDQTKRTTSLLLLALLQNGMPEERRQIRDILLQSRLPVAMEQVSVICAIGRGTETDLVLPDLPHLALKIGRRSLAILAANEHRSAIIESLSQASQGIDGIGIGGRIAREERLETAIQSAIQTSAWAASGYFLTGRRGEAHIYREPEDDPGERMLRLSHAVKHGSSAAVTDLLRQLQTSLKEGRSDIRHAVRLYGLVLSLVGRTGEDEPPEELAPSYTTLLETFDDADQMIAFCEKELLAAMAPAAPNPDSVANETIKRIAAYMERSYSDNLSLPSIADKFKLHPNYISNLFQREMKTTFTKLLARIRLDHACSLLKETELTINEVAEKTGYEDYFYFAKVFKKRFGMSPSQYRSLEGGFARTL